MPKTSIAIVVGESWFIKKCRVLFEETTVFSGSFLFKIVFFMGKGIVVLRPLLENTFFLLLFFFSAYITFFLLHYLS